jgi:hypothetical protein
VARSSYLPSVPTSLRRNMKRVNGKCPGLSTATTLLVLFLQTDGTLMKRVALVHHGPEGLPSLLCADTDHDGLGEIIYSAFDTVHDYQMWEILEYRPFNRYEVVKSDTGIYPYPPGQLVSGNFWLYDVGDVDRDGRADIVGELRYAEVAGYDKGAICVMESPDSASYPDSIVWLWPYPWSLAVLYWKLYADLDGDSNREIVEQCSDGTAVFENVADNRESLVWRQQAGRYGLSVWSDFDLNGRNEFIGRGGDCERIIECNGDNSYAEVDSVLSHTVNGSDIFAGRDADQNGRPEFFIPNARYELPGWWFDLYMYEAEAEHDYVVYPIASVGENIDDPNPRASLCADIDGDGVDEVIWACCRHVRVLKATGPHQFEEVWNWRNDHGANVTYCNAWDMNGNGYKEVLVGGNSKISVFEVEAVQVVNPNGGQEFIPGDTCTIRWRVLTPPRCDSVSLFLRSDTNAVNGFYRLDTIAHGLSPSESTYSWSVPDTTLDSVRILAIAYGPGWQFDESDSTLRIAPAGVAGPLVTPPREWALSVSPNPARGAFAVRYDVPRQCRVSVGVYDAGGRLVSPLSEGDVAPGRYESKLAPGALPAGIYFCRLAAGGQRFSRKVVLTE